MWRELNLFFSGSFADRLQGIAEAQLCQQFIGIRYGLCQRCLPALIFL